MSDLPQRRNKENDLIYFSMTHEQKTTLTVGSSMAIPWVFSADIKGLVVEVKVAEDGGGGGGDGLLVFGVVGRENIVFFSSSWNGELDMFWFVNYRKKWDTVSLTLSLSLYLF